MSHVLVQPFEFEPAEVGADGQPRDRAEVILAAQLLGHSAAQLTGADVQPHDRVAQRLARVPVPDDGGLPLVGDAQRLDRYGAVFGFGLLRSNAQHSGHECIAGQVQCSCVFLPLMHATLTASLMHSTTVCQIVKGSCSHHLHKKYKGIHD